MPDSKGSKSCFFSNVLFLNYDAREKSQHCDDNEEKRKKRVVWRVQKLLGPQTVASAPAFLLHESVPKVHLTKGPPNRKVKTIRLFQFPGAEESDIKAPQNNENT